MRIIPAIDIINGKCVRLTKGDYNTQKIYNENPLEVAKAFEDSGLQFLHLVDLDGAKSGRIVNAKILEIIATKTNLQIDFGGGLKTATDVETAFNSGANQITVGSVAVKNQTVLQQWIKEYGAAKIILGADCRDGKIAISGWQETSDLQLLPFINTYESLGIKQVICTDISKDGMLEGPSFERYSEILSQSTVKLIASGGIASMEDLKKLKEMGCEGAIIGKAIYENRISLNQLKELC